MSNENQKHIFAFYVEQLSLLVAAKTGGDVVMLEDKRVCHRIIQVLRLQPGDVCILFDSTIHVRFLIQELASKKNISGIMEEKKYNTILQPHITVLLPLLKRDDLDTALYSLVEMGVNTIQLMITKKVQRKWGKEKEYDRLQRVMIAAAEQSKNFALPLLHSPQSFEQFLITIPSSIIKIYFDPTGEPLLSLIDKIKKCSSTSIMLMVGPEGDLTEQEKEQLRQTTFLFCALTPTVLRSSQAIALGAGIIRSIV